jgi:hypothetical protein
MVVGLRGAACVWRDFPPLARHLTRCKSTFKFPTTYPPQPPCRFVSDLLHRPSGRPDGNPDSKLNGFARSATVIEEANSQQPCASCGTRSGLRQRVAELEALLAVRRDPLARVKADTQGDVRTDSGVTLTREDGLAVVTASEHGDSPLPDSRAAVVDQLKVCVCVCLCLCVFVCVCVCVFVCVCALL